MADDTNQPKPFDTDGIFRVDTVPPPPGEGDAYNAPTRVGEMPESVLEAMKKAAEQGTALKPMSLPKSSQRPASTPDVEELDHADLISQRTPGIAFEPAPAPAPAPAVEEPAPPVEAKGEAKGDAKGDAETLRADAKEVAQFKPVGSMAVSAALVAMLFAIFAIAYLLLRNS
jgi:hypothetical protein